MEFFESKTMMVKLRSYLEKYLVADDDGETLRQSRRSANSRNARWLVETVKGKDDVIRLRSCHGSYLTAVDAPFLLGLTGKKVLLTKPGSDPDPGQAIEWEPIRDGFQVRLRTSGGKYLRANGGTPPWRNSITHDEPHMGGATRNWVLWDVEEISEAESGGIGTPSIEQYLSSMSSFSSVSDEILSAFGSETDSPRPVRARAAPPPKKSLTLATTDQVLSTLAVPHTV